MIDKLSGTKIKTITGDTYYNVATYEETMADMKAGGDYLEILTISRDAGGVIDKRYKHTINKKHIVELCPCRV